MNSHVDGGRSRHDHPNCSRVRPILASCPRQCPRAVRACRHFPRRCRRARSRRRGRGRGQGSRPCRCHRVAARRRQGLGCINDTTTSHWCDDVDALAGVPGLEGVMLAKAESGQQVDATADALPDGTKILVLIESAMGLEAAPEIARAEGVFRLVFGSGDFRRDTGMSASPLAMAYPRSRLVVTSRAAKLPGPIDGPSLTDDPTILEQEAQLTQSMGMSGKLCMTPDRARFPNAALSPSTDDIGWAHTIIDRLGEDGHGVKDGSDYRSWRGRRRSKNSLGCSGSRARAEPPATSRTSPSHTGVTRGDIPLSRGGRPVRCRAACAGCAGGSARPRWFRSSLERRALRPSDRTRFRGHARAVPIREVPFGIDPPQRESLGIEEGFDDTGAIVREVGEHPFAVRVRRRVEVDDGECSAGAQDPHRVGDACAAPRAEEVRGPGVHEIHRPSGSGMCAADPGRIRTVAR